MSNKVRSIEIENYKSIKKSGEIRIPGITLILGPNGSGKTNILESLLLLKQTLENNQLNLKLNGNIVKTGEFRNIIFRQDLDKNLTYKFHFDNSLGDQDPDLICPVCGKEYTYEGYFTNHMGENHSQFWDKSTKSERKLFSDHYSSAPSIELSYSFDRQSKSSVLKSIRLHNPEPVDGLHISELEVVNTAKRMEIRATSIKGQKIIDIGSSNEEANEMFDQNPNYLTGSIGRLLHTKVPGRSSVGERRFIPRVKNVESNSTFAQIDEKLQSKNLPIDSIEKVDYEDRYEVREGLLTGLIARLMNISFAAGQYINHTQSFLSEISHVGPLRSSPRRIYYGAGGSPGLQPENDNQVERQIFSSEQSQNRSLIETTNRWLAETGFDCQLSVTEVGVGDLYQLEVIQSGLSVNLADAGFGLSQTLPIIIECINMRIEDESSTDGAYLRRFSKRQSQTPLGLIEQPEIHLNPRIEASLGDFFIDVMKSDPKLMIETHSEHLLNRIQRRIADGTIENENNVVIYFISKEEDSSHIREIEISSKGVFSDWPEGFFQDDFDDAMETLKESL